MDIIWNITQLTAHKALSGCKNVINHARYTMTVTITANGQEYSNTFPGATPITVKAESLSGDNFVDYADLDKQTIVSWITGSMGWQWEGFRDRMFNELYEKANTPIQVTFDNPWSPPTSTPPIPPTPPV